MDIVKKVKEKFGEIPQAIKFSEICSILGKKVGKINIIDDEILDAGEKLAMASPRMRSLILLHDDFGEIVHRMINTLRKGTYAAPHKHVNPDTLETFFVLRGTLCLLEFTEDGKVVRAIHFGENCKTKIVEVKPETYHSVLPITDIVSCIEVKGQSSYDKDKDKFFPDWAPKEGDKEVPAYLEKLYKQAGA